MTPCNMPNPEADKILRLGGTTIRFIVPEKMTEQERQLRHGNIVKAVARCLAHTRE